MFKTRKSRIYSWRAYVSVFCLSLMLLYVPILANASGVGQSSAEAYSALKSAVGVGKYLSIAGGKDYDFSATQYKLKGGGYAFYTEVTGISNGVDFVDKQVLEKLSSSSKQTFLKNELTIANAMAADTAAGSAGCIVTDDTVDSMTQILSDAGAGTTLMTTLLGDTKPNFSAANRILSPWSGPVNTAIAIGCIIIIFIALVSVFIDFAYIEWPGFQGDAQAANNGGGDGKKTAGGVLGRFVTPYCKQAVLAEASSEGGQGGGGTSALMTWGKRRAIEYFVLFGLIALFITGAIWPLISSVFDKLSDIFTNF